MFTTILIILKKANLWLYLILKSSKNVLTPVTKNITKSKKKSKHNYHIDVNILINLILINMLRNLTALLFKKQLR